MQSPDFEVISSGKRKRSSILQVWKGAKASYDEINNTLDGIDDLLFEDLGSDVERISSDSSEAEFLSFDDED